MSSVLSRVVAASMLAGVTVLAHADGGLDKETTSPPLQLSPPPAVVAPEAASRVVLIGMPIAQLPQTDFFTYFHFVKMREAPDAAHPGTQMLWYGMSGKYNGAVNLLVSVGKDSNQSITHAALMVNRDFINAVETNDYARDLVKSFLELSSGINSKELVELRREITEGCDRDNKNFPINHRNELAEKQCSQGDKNSQAYLAFAGRMDKVRMNVGKEYVMLQNPNKFIGVPLLFIELGVQ